MWTRMADALKPSNLIWSSPATSPFPAPWKSTITSVAGDEKSPGEKTKVSAPAPPVSVSTPGPPFNTSLPAPPFRESAPEPPVMVSSPP